MSAISSFSSQFNERIETLIGSPETAKIYLLGDTHTDKTQIKLRQAVLDRFAKPGDIVLCEGRQRYIMLNPDFIPETNGRRDLWVFGWDDIETIKEANRHLAYQLDICNELQRRRENNTLTPFCEDIAAKAALLSFATTTNKLDFGIRNDWMREAIDTMSQFAPGQNIFVISGSSHFEEPQVKKIQDLAPTCLMIFTKNPKTTPINHAEKISKQTNPSLLSHLVPLRDAVGPCCLRHPKKTEDMRNLNFVNEPSEKKVATPLPEAKK